MLDNGVDNRLAELVLGGDINSLFDVGDQDPFGHGWCQFVMPVHAAGLIFNKIQGFFDFTDIMIITAHLGEKRVGTDITGGRFNH